MDDFDATDAGRDDDLTAIELADGLLENVVKCPDCAKPILQSAIEDHAGARALVRRLVREHDRLAAR